MFCSISSKLRACRYRIKITLNIRDLLFPDIKDLTPFKADTLFYASHEKNSKHNIAIKHASNQKAYRSTFKKYRMSMILHPSKKEGGTGGMVRLLSLQITEVPPSTPGWVILAISFLSLRVFKVFRRAVFPGGNTTTSEIFSSVALRLS